MEVETRATEVKNECLYSMQEDVEHYHQVLIDMKEQYQKNVKVFAKVTQLTSNNIQLTCILGTL